MCDFVLGLLADFADGSPIVVFGRQSLECVEVCEFVIYKRLWLLVVITNAKLR